MSPHVSSTMCSSAAVQNCIIQHLVSPHSEGGRPVNLCTGRPPTGMIIPDAE